MIGNYHLIRSDKVDLNLMASLQEVSFRLPRGNGLNNNADRKASLPNDRGADYDLLVILYRVCVWPQSSHSFASCLCVKMSDLL